MHLRVTNTTDFGLQASGFGPEGVEQSQEATNWNLKPTGSRAQGTRHPAHPNGGRCSVSRPARLSRHVAAPSAEDPAVPRPRPQAHRPRYLAGERDEASLQTSLGSIAAHVEMGDSPGLRRAILVGESSRASRFLKALIFGNLRRVLSPPAGRARTRPRAVLAA
jgi:hypothetical protein